MLNSINIWGKFTTPPGLSESMEQMNHAKELAREAAGDYVTAERLIGNADYYPNIMKSLHDFETPHHICLLKSYDVFKIIFAESPAKLSRVNYVKGVLVATDDFVHIIFSEADMVNSMITSYDAISNVNIKKKSPRRRIEIKFGNKSAYWRLVEAKTTPDDMLDQTIQFIQTQAQENSIFFNKPQ